MGVDGLTTLVESTGSLHYQKKLFDSKRAAKVVIDGTGLLWFLLRKILRADLLSHGGEYDLLRAQIRDFFQSLSKCGCRPYVIFDGSYEDKLRDKSVKRFEDRIKKAEEILDGKKGLLGCPFGLSVMKQVLTELGVRYAFSQFKPDRDIAILANHWKCRVISDDSDYFVMDIKEGYIPLTHLKWRNLKETEDGQFFMSGDVYRIESFCESNGLTKGMLPLYASLLGNDYIRSFSVEPFLSEHVFRGNSRTRHEKREDIVEWFRRNERRGATALQEELERHLSDELREMLSDSINLYRIEGESSDLKYFFERSNPMSDHLSNSRLCSEVGVPPHVALLHQAGTVDNMCINILSSGYIFSQVQVENPVRNSAWLTAEYLFRVISGIMTAGRAYDQTAERRRCIVYIRNVSESKELHVPPLDSVPEFGKLPTLDEIPHLDGTIREKLLFLVLANSESVILQRFPEEFRLALLGTIYCIRSSKTMTTYHIRSLLVGWVYLYAKRQHEKRKSRTSAADRESTRSKEALMDHRFIAEKMSHYQDLLREETPNPDISHGFAQWQQCLVYTFNLNDLLQSPLPPCPEVTILYSGIFMHGLYSDLEIDVPMEQIEFEFFPDAPNAYDLFQSMYKFVYDHTTQG